MFPSLVVTRARRRATCAVVLAVAGVVTPQLAGVGERPRRRWVVAVRHDDEIVSIAPEGVDQRGRN